MMYSFGLQVGIVEVVYHSLYQPEGASTKAATFMFDTTGVKTTKYRCVFSLYGLRYVNHSPLPLVLTGMRVEIAKENVLIERSPTQPCRGG